MATSVIKKQREGFPFDVGQYMTTPINFNDFISPGVYTFSLNEAIQNSTNRPCDYAGRLYVWSRDGTAVNSAPWRNAVQEYIDIRTGIYYRWIESQSSPNDILYGDWVKVQTTTVT